MFIPPSYLYNRNPNPGKAFFILRWDPMLSAWGWYWDGTQCCLLGVGRLQCPLDWTLSPDPFSWGITASWQQLPQAQVNYLDQLVNWPGRPVDFDVLCWWSVHRSLDQGEGSVFSFIWLSRVWFPCIFVQTVTSDWLQTLPNTHNRIKSLSAEQNGRHFVQMTFSDAFSRKKRFIIWCTFHRSFYPGVQLATSQHWFR